MRKPLIKNLIFTVVCLALPAVFFAQNNQSNKVLDIALKDLQGKTVKIKEFKGKVVLLNFWATWCPPCRAEIPELIKWQKEYENQGLQIVGITYPPTNRLKVRRFVRRNKINYPILFGSKNTKAIFDSGETMPLTVVIDRNGNIKEIIEGIVFAEEFDEKVKPLLDSRIDKKDSKLQLKKKINE
ncbi:MAG: TlpA family protein disulfide reductase [Acidobacteriota bacterium]|nr:TlpA family protein disulfide reductase [Acidobacteriota bacterium]